MQKSVITPFIGSNNAEKSIVTPFKMRLYAFFGVETLFLALQAEIWFITAHWFLKKPS